MNVGASKPTDYGLYFQWGDTIGYTADQVGKDKQFTWDDYKFSINGSSTNFSKYGVSVLQLEDDAAHVNMGGTWHMPTYGQVDELFENTDFKFTTLDGVGGVTFTSKNDSSKSIFFPAAGKGLNGSIIQSGEGVAIWLDRLVSNDSGLCVYTDTSGDEGSSLQRYTGLPIRGVIETSANTNGYSYVDLGLPSGTLWATCNVGASKPSDYGLYFQWGDTSGYTADQVGKDKQFNWADYKFNPSGDGKTFTKYTKIGDKLELEDDAAHANMGGDWHMPTPTQISELLNTAYTKNEWTTQYGVNGRLFTSKTDPSKSIFIPAAGYASYGSLYNVWHEADVWSSTLNTDNAFGQYLYFNSNNVYLDRYTRCGGLSVRGVIG